MTEQTEPATPAVQTYRDNIGPIYWHRRPDGDFSPSRSAVCAPGWRGIGRYSEPWLLANRDVEPYAAPDLAGTAATAPEQAGGAVLRLVTDADAPRIQVWDAAAIRAQRLEDDNRYLRDNLASLGRELVKYRPDVRAWIDWMAAILAESSGKFAMSRSHAIAGGLMRALAPALTRWRRAGESEADLLLLLPEAGFHGIEDGEGSNTICGVRCRIVPGLAWPVLGIELVRP